MVSSELCGQEIFTESRTRCGKPSIRTSLGVFYVCAIAFAKDTRSLFMQALANERAGRYCFMKLNQPHEAVSYFVQSLLVYEEWAAHRKVNHLQAELKGLFGTDEYDRWFINPT
jgi:hypothetical protein